MDLANDFLGIGVCVPPLDLPWVGWNSTATVHCLLVHDSVVFGDDMSACASLCVEPCLSGTPCLRMWNRMWQLGCESIRDELYCILARLVIGNPTR